MRYCLKDNYDFETISKFTGITTARGRHQAKVIFKRKVDKIMIENEEKGVFEPKKIVE